MLQSKPANVFIYVFSALFCIVTQMFSTVVLMVGIFKLMGGLTAGGVKG